MIYCSKCGKQLNPGTKFCPGCGTPVPPEPSDMNNTGAQGQQPAGGFSTGSPAAPIPHQIPAQQPQFQNQQQYNAPYSGADPRQNGKKKSKGAIAGIIAALILLAGAGGTVGYLLVKNHMDDSSSSSKKKTSKTQAAEEDDDDEEDTTRKTRAKRKATEAETTEEKTERETTEPTTEPTTEATTEKPTEAPTVPGNSNDLGVIKLGTGGSQFTVVSWNADDAPAMISEYERNGGQKAVFYNMDCRSSEAVEKYDNFFLSGNDIDLYFCEADWALHFVNDSSKAAPLEALGFTEDNFADAYAYTNEVGRATSGANAGKMVGVSWQACPGGFAYNAELAERYLGVRTPEEMQAKVGNWDSFAAAAAEIAEKSNHKVALADSLGGMWQVFSANRTSPWVSDGCLVVDDSCKMFADYAKYLWDNGGVTHNDQWSSEWVPAGQNGNCMGYFASTWGLGGFLADASYNSAGNWRLIQGPDPYFWGGTWMLVNPKTDNGEEAQKFIYTMAVDPESMKHYSLSKPDYVNNISVMDEVISNGEVNAQICANFGGQNYFEPLHANAKNLNLKGLITPYDAAIKSAFLQSVTDCYCKGGYDWDTTVTEFKRIVDTYYPSGF